MVNHITPYFGNPLKGTDGQSTHCAFRWMVRVNGRYHEFDEGYYDKWQIYTRTSEDGIIFSPKSEPLFPSGGPGSFDERGQADPTVIVEDEWKMWFDAFDNTLHWDALGYATSEDGFSWVNHGPVLYRGKEGEWDSKSIHHPVCIKPEKNYYLFYSGCGEGDQNNVKHIGLAISEDGKNWKKYPEPVITTGRDWDSIYVRPSKPIFLNGLWNMFYWGFDGLHHMGLAVSDDLIHWRKMGRILEGKNEREGITASMPVDDENGLRIYYATFDDIRFRMAKIE